MSDTGTSACANTLQYPISPCPTPTTSVGTPTTAYTGSAAIEAGFFAGALLLLGAIAIASARRRSR